jgi:hypothetical protein
MDGDLVERLRTTGPVLPGAQVGILDVRPRLIEAGHAFADPVE